MIDGAGLGQPLLKHRRLATHTVQVKVRYGDFTTLTRQITVEEPLTEANDIYRLDCPYWAGRSCCPPPFGCSVWGWLACMQPSERQLLLL